MTTNQIVDSSFTAIINAPIEKIDIPTWCFNLSETEYQGCSPAHIAAGFTTAPDGKRMSINVETIGGSLMVQHYVETLGEKNHLILDSTSDVFTPTGRTTIHVTWELSAKEIEPGKCEFTNRVRSYATDEFMAFIGKQGIPFDLFRAQRQPASIAHNQSETPLFAASIERAALSQQLIVNRGCAVNGAAATAMEASMTDLSTTRTSPRFWWSIPTTTSSPKAARSGRGSRPWRRRTIAFRTCSRSCMRLARRSFGFSMPCITATVPATMAPGSTSPPCSGRRGETRASSSALGVANSERNSCRRPARSSPANTGAPADLPTPIWIFSSSGTASSGLSSSD